MSAERKEDQDIGEGPVRLFEREEPAGRILEVAISGGNLVLSGYDFGEIVESVSGDYDYEYWVTVPKEQKDRLILALMKQVFGGNGSAEMAFRKFLEANGIPCSFYCWR